MSGNLNVSFMFRPDTVIGSVFPSTGPQAGFTNVSVVGVNLSPQSICMFGQQRAERSIWMSATQLICVSPAGLAFGVLLLQIVSPDELVLGASFKIMPDPQVERLHPTVGPTAGGTLVAVSGTNLNANASCVFGTSAPVPAYWLGPGQLECRTVPHVATNVSFSLRSGAHVYRSTELLFSFVEPCKVLSIAPTMGPDGGGVHVVLRGSGFTPHEPVVRFGSIVVPGNYVDSSTIECETPRQLAGKSSARSVAASMNGQNFCENSVPFFFETMTIHRVHPLLGPQAGGTRVQIDGSQYPARGTLQCAFGTGGYSVAERVSPTRIECVTPPGTIGRISLSVIDGGAVRASSMEAFEYQGVTTISAVSPNTGMTRGGTAIVVRGSHFSVRSASLSYLRCRFNLTAVPAEYINATAVMCVSPPHEMSRTSSQPQSAFIAGEVVLEVSSNILDFTGGSHVHFYYSDAVFVSSLTPPLGPINGQTPVNVAGSNFVASQGLACLFGAKAAVATFHSTQHVSCMAPSHVSGAVPVRVTVGGNVTSYTHAMYTFTPQTRVSYISPANGPGAGGTILVVAGASFSATRQLRCRFGEIEVPAVRVSSSFVNCTTPQHDAGVVTVEMSDNGVDFSSDQISFLYQDTVNVHSIAPGVIPANSTVAFRVLGSNFLPASTCQINDGIVAMYASFISPNEIICVFDGTQELGTANVRVSNNLQDFTESYSTISIEETWTVQSLDPVMGPARGGTPVQVTGKNFVDGKGLTCRFGTGSAPASARFISSTQLECRAPPHSAANVTLEVSVNNQDFSTSGIIFEYQPTPVVYLLKPRQGPVGGGTLVIVQGALFSERAASLEYIFCRFGEQLSPGRFVASDTLQCVSPPSVVGKVALEVSMNRRDFSANGVTFSYVGPTIQSIHPTLGPELGGTHITIDGTNMPHGVLTQCRFGASGTAPAVWVSSVRMQCSTPPIPPGIIILSVFTAGGGMAAFANQTFESQPSAAVYSLLPDAGPVLGGTSVVLVGERFSSRAAALLYLSCRFDLMVSNATWLNTTALACVAPAFAGELPGSVAVRMSNNLFDFTEDSVAFTYLPEVQVTSVMPPNGPLLGGSLVTVRGNNFLPRPSKCRFGASVVQATHVSSNTLQCTSPPAQLPNVSQAVLISVSTNDGVDFALPQVQFTYHPSVIVQTVMPSVGPQQGRTRVSVVGDGFTDSAALRCKFGEIVVDATFVSTTVVNCTSPAQPGGAVTLEVSTNAFQYSSSNTTFVYAQPVNVLFLTPSMGPARGGTNVTVIGEGIVDGSRCRFGDLAALASMRVSSTEMVCVPPPLEQGRYAVEVTSNLQDYTSNRIEFEYIAMPEVLTIDPLAGPARGASLVQVTGKSFVAHPALMCRFGTGSAPASARFISSTQLECRAPPHSAANVTLEVSVNNQDFSTSGIIFEYQPTPVVYLLKPRQGPVGGGTLVIVQGALFSERAASLEYIFCRFGEQLSPGRFVASDTLQCVSPPSVVGKVALEVSMNRRDFSANGVTFSYVGPTIQSIHPTLGPELGGTAVTLSTDFLPAGMHLYCTFGFLSATAVRLNDSLALCISPQNVQAEVGLHVVVHNEVLM